MPATKVDNPEVPSTKATHRYVTVPDTDLFDQSHPPIRINSMSFGPGTHWIENELANTVEERLKAYQRSNVRILQPKRDTESERLVEVNRGTSGSATTNF